MQETSEASDTVWAFARLCRFGESVDCSTLGGAVSGDLSEPEMLLRHGEAITKWSSALTNDNDLSNNI